MMRYNHEHKRPNVMHPRRKRKAISPALDLYQTASEETALVNKSNGRRPHEQQTKETTRM
jgi:hypothetical protein